MRLPAHPHTCPPACPPAAPPTRPTTHMPARLPTHPHAPRPTAQAVVISPAPGLCYLCITPDNVMQVGGGGGWGAGVGGASRPAQRAEATWRSLPAHTCPLVAHARRRLLRCPVGQQGACGQEEEKARCGKPDPPWLIAPHRLRRATGRSHGPCLCFWCCSHPGGVGCTCNLFNAGLPEGPGPGGCGSRAPLPPSSLLLLTCRRGGAAAARACQEVMQPLSCWTHARLTAHAPAVNAPSLPFPARPPAGV